MYQIHLPICIGRIVNADCRVEYDGKSYLLPLRVQKTFKDDGDNPFASSLDVSFESSDTFLANLGSTGIKRFDVTVKP